jgi:hypothetical protein
MAMTYQQVHEILNDIRRVHEEAAACCAAVDDASDERLRLLAGLFRDGEAQLAMRLKQSQEGVPVEEDTRAAASLERWVQFVPTGGVDKALRNLRAATDEGSEATFVACMALHEQMVKALRHLAEIVPAGEAHDLFQHLANMEEQAMRDLGLADTMRKDG